MIVVWIVVFAVCVSLVFGLFVGRALRRDLDELRRWSGEDDK